MASLYTIGRVARITGLTPGCIRAWESRYAAVTPERTSSGRRTYTEDNVSRLKLLAEIIGYGYGISSLAGLTDEELQRELETARANEPKKQVITVVEQVVANILKLDIAECDSRLAAAFVNLGPWQLAETVVLPLLQAVDDDPKKQLNAAQRLLLLNLIRSRLYASFQSLQVLKKNPAICFATLEGEEHEIDALLACFLARASGVYSEFIGPNFSVANIVEIAEHLGCGLIGVCVRSPVDQSAAVSRLADLRTRLPANAELWVVGERAPEAASSIPSGQCVIVESLTRLREELEKASFDRV